MLQQRAGQAAHGEGRAAERAGLHAHRHRGPVLQPQGQESDLRVQSWGMRFCRAVQKVSFHSHYKKIYL